MATPLQPGAPASLQPSMTETVSVPSARSSQSALHGTSDKGSLKNNPSGKAAENLGEAPLQLSRFRFWAITCSLMLSIFLFALDQLIIATAIPKITARFNSLTQLPWLASGFFLPLFGLNLIFSQWNQIFPSKHVILFAVFVFELGSLICGVAPSMDVLILGRAIAGAGAAGIFSGGMIIVAEITPLHQRAQFMALFGICFALASILGPLVGGAFSDHVSWRWCFYINLPIGGIALLLLTLFMPSSAPLGQRNTYKGYSKKMLWQVLHCDYVGAAIAMGWAVSLILALQWGGVEKRWNDGSVIATLVLTGVLPFVFYGWTKWLGPERAMFKLHLFKRRTIWGASMVLFWMFAAFMLDVYYLSIALQAAYGFSATDAGVRLLPLIMVQIVVLIASSRVIPILGRFKWIIFAGPLLIALASGLLYSVKYGTSLAHLYGYMVILGVGIGMSLQNSMLAVQFEVRKTPQFIALSTGIATFVGFAGRIVGISLATSVFQNMIVKNLHKYAPQLPEQLMKSVVNDASAVWTTVPIELREPVLRAYTETLRPVYLIGVPMGILGSLCALAIKNSKMPTKAEEEARIAAMRERDALAAAGEKPTGVDVEGAPKTAEVGAESVQPVDKV